MRQRSADRVEGQFPFPRIELVERGGRGSAIPSISVGFQLETSRRRESGLVFISVMTSAIGRPFFLRPEKRAIGDRKQGRDRPIFRRTPHPLLFLKQIHSNFLLGRQRFSDISQRAIRSKSLTPFCTRYLMLVSPLMNQQFVDDGLQMDFLVVSNGNPSLRSKRI